MVEMVIVVIFLVLGVMVIFFKNPIHSVISLILVCLNMVNVVLSLGVEYFGIILLLVYVGAIAVLFLFVVMMINVRFVERLSVKVSYVPFAILVGLILCVEFLSMIYGNSGEVLSGDNREVWVSSLFGLSNIEVNGMGLYLMYKDGVVLGGFILLVGIIGSLGITGRSRERVLERELLKVTY